VEALAHRQIRDAWKSHQPSSPRSEREYDIVDEDKVDAGSDRVINGLQTLDEFTDQTGYVLPTGPYTTVVGFFMAQLKAVPNLGDRIVVDAEEVSDDEPRPVRLLEFRVTEMDGHRAAGFALRRVDDDSAQELLGSSPPVDR
jgi:putative hemolysin